MSSSLGLSTVELFKKLSIMESKVLDFDRMLALLNDDLLLAQRGYEINFAIDFHDLFRFLYPQWDNTRNISASKFSLEQSILHYIFDDSSYNILFLHTYFKEFESKLVRMRNGCESLLSSYGNTLNRKEAEERNSHLTNAKIPQEVRGFKLHWMDCHGLQDAMGESLNLLESLFSKNKLYFLEQRCELIGPGKIEQSSAEYNDILRKMIRRRPSLEKTDNNKTDAIAISSIKRLTEKNIDKKLIFLLLSSSPVMESVFLDIKIQLTIGDKLIELPISRNLIYVLLKFYYSKWELEKAISDIENKRILTGQYILELSDLKSRMVERDLQNEDLQKLSELEDDLSKCFLPFENSIIDRANYKPIFDGEINFVVNGEIKDYIEDPAKLMSLVQDAFVALSNAINNLRQLKINYGLIGSLECQ
jgi:hypothetical protein